MKYLFNQFCGKPAEGHRIGSFLAVLLVPLVSVTLASGQAAKSVLSRQVPAAISKFQLKPVKSMEPSKRLKLAIGLPLRDQAGLNQLVADIYNPASTNFHHYVTADEFAQRFGPTVQDYQAVIAFAESHGFKVTGTHPNRTLLDVEAAAVDAEKAFHVNLHVYTHPKENRTFYAPDQNPSLDLAVPILSVRGLDNYTLPRPLISREPMNLVTNRSLLGSGPFGTFMGTDFRKAYAPGVALTGAGQTVALFECDGYFASDIAAYVTRASLPTIPLQNVLIDQFDGSAGFGNSEVALDIEMAICMAPGLSKIIVYEGPFDTASIDTDILNRIATDNSARQISSSWLIDDTPQHGQIYLQFAAQGQTFFQASGDEGGYFPGIFQFEDSPLVTLVGGTTLTTDDSGAWSSETVWNWRNEFGEIADGIAGGGGISTLYPIPSWQQGVSMALNGGSATMRNIPDIALTADNIFVIADDGTDEPGTGGTSCAAPLWAAFMAMVNQQAASLGLPPLGFINPTLYAIGGGAANSTSFHDITTGDNTSSLSPNSFFATPGYDLCTGWGTPAGRPLINAMLAITRSGLLQISVNPPSGSALIGSANQSVFVTVNDISGITNATVTVSIPGVVTNLTLANNGVSPDSRANDNTNSGTIQAPASGPFTMTVTATAPNEFGITNHVNYTAIPVPQNNDFSSATKVPAAGATYLANNQFATLEPNEKKHANDSNDVASLWWDWMPSGNTNVFVDTTGSAIDTVLAVYTGTALTNLVAVAATNDVGLVKQGYLSFNALAQHTYHIAVAGANATALGSIHLAITPGGQVDTVSPTLLVSTPPSPYNGSWVTNRFLALAGTANDPSPNSSGVSQVLMTVNNNWQFVADGTTNWSGYFAMSSAVRNGLNTIRITAQDVNGNISAPVNLQFTIFSPGPPNDLFAEAIPLTGNSGTVSASNTNASKEFGEPDHAGNGGGKSLWWNFTPSSDGVLTLDTTGSTFDTLVGVYLGTVVGGLTPVAENDNANDFIFSSLLSFAVRSNQVYEIAVDGFDGASGQISLNYSFTPAQIFRVAVSSSLGGSVQVTSTNSAGGTVIMPGTTGDFASASTIALTGMPIIHFQFGSWTGSVVSSNNPVSIVVQSNLDIAGMFVPFAYTDGFESGNFSALPWTTSGNAPWFVQRSVVAGGQFAAQSGIIANNQSSSLVLSANFTNGFGSFDYKVSSETNFDFLNFFVDGVLQQQWSGEAGWATYSFSLSTNSHVLEWRYTKDPSVSSGKDAAYLDDLILPLAVAAPVTPPAPAQLKLSRGTDGGLVLDLQGGVNQQYILQTSTDLVHWMNVSTNTAVGGQVHLPVPVGTNQSQFYRAQLSH